MPEKEELQSKESESATDETTEKVSEEVAEEGDAQEEEQDTLETDELPKGGKGKYVPLDRFNKVYGRMKEMERTLQEMVHNQLTAERQPTRKATDDEVELPDFKNMSEAQLVKWNLNQQRRMINDAVKEALAPVNMNIEQQRAAADIQATSKKYADFWDYRMEMADIAERHPSLSAEQCYLLATGNTQAVKRSVAEQTKKKLALKKAARTETRSTSGEKVTERKEFKTVKEAGLAAAKKLGLIS